MNSIRTRIRIAIVKMRIRFHMILNRSSMNEKTSRLLAELVDLEGAPLEKKYRIVK